MEFLTGTPRTLIVELEIIMQHINVNNVACHTCKHMVPAAPGYCVLCGSDFNTNVTPETDQETEMLTIRVPVSLPAMAWYGERIIMQLPQFDPICHLVPRAISRHRASDGR